MLRENFAVNFVEYDMIKKCVIALFVMYVVMSIPALAQPSALQTTSTKGTASLELGKVQLLSRPIRVFIPDKVINRDMHPELCLARSRDIAQTTKNAKFQCPGGMLYTPFEVMPNHKWRWRSTGIEKTGTLMLFMLSGTKDTTEQYFTISSYRIGVFVLPILSWKVSAQSSKREVAISNERVYISSGYKAFAWTVLLIFCVAVVAHFLLRGKNGIIGLLCTADNFMSISLTQMALWTVAVSAIVLGFGLAFSGVPEIPDTLFWLMGFSVATTVVGNFQADQIVLNRSKISANQGTHKPALSDLLMLHGTNDDQEDSDLAKTQLLLWTIVTIVLFVYKSIGSGELWNVPTELVALMGISQTGYLARKQIAIKSDKNTNNPGSMTGKVSSLVAGIAGTLHNVQSFSGTRAVDVTAISKTDHIIEGFTIDGLNFEGANSAFVGARIYNSATKKLLACSNVTVPGGSNRVTVTIPISATLIPGQSYRLGCYIKTEPLGKDLGDFFQATAFSDINDPKPYNEASGMFTINSAYSIESDVFPSVKSTLIPQMSIFTRCPV